MVGRVFKLFLYFHILYMLLRFWACLDWFRTNIINFILEFFASNSLNHIVGANSQSFLFFNFYESPCLAQEDDREVQQKRWSHFIHKMLLFFVLSKSQQFTQRKPYIISISLKYEPRACLTRIIDSSTI